MTFKGISLGAGLVYSIFTCYAFEQCSKNYTHYTQYYTHNCCNYPTAHTVDIGNKGLCPLYWLSLPSTFCHRNCVLITFSVPPNSDQLTTSLHTYAIFTDYFSIIRLQQTVMLLLYYAVVLFYCIMLMKNLFLIYHAGMITTYVI